jgi:hypothetical protein
MRMIRRSMVTFGMGIVLAAVLTPAIGLTSAEASTSSPTSVAAPASAKTIVLTNSSDGSTVLASIGDLVVVELSGGPLRWSEARAVPTTSATPPVLVRVSGSTSANGSSTTTFRVATYGTARIDATGTPICSPGHACPQFVLLWQASVVVPTATPPVAVTG